MESRFNQLNLQSLSSALSSISNEAEESVSKAITPTPFNTPRKVKLQALIFFKKEHMPVSMSEQATLVNTGLNRK